MSHKPDVGSELSRELTLFHITMMGLGMMIGAGVFLGIGNSVRDAGPGGVLLTFALNGVIALFTAFSYAELSSAVPQTGGAYNYMRLGFGRGPSFLAGWMEWFASSVAGSLYGVTFGIYVVLYLEKLGLLTWLPVPVWVAEKIVAVVVIGLFIYTNYRGASETGKIGAFFTLGQTLFMLLIGVIGVAVVLRDPSRLANFEPFMPHGWHRLLATMGLTYVAFEGYEVIAQTGDEAIDPRRNLPKAMIYSVFVVTITYVLVAFAAVVAVKATGAGDLVHKVTGEVLSPWEWIGHHGERGFGEAVARLLPAGSFLLTLAVIFASTSALNATVYSATRALYALGRDRMLPGALAKISAKRKTPYVALSVTAVLVVIVAMLPTLEVAGCASMMFLALFFLVNICVIRVRLNMGDELTYGFLMPFFPVLPILAIIAQVVLVVWLLHGTAMAFVIGPLWVIAGVAVYFLYARSHAKPGVHEIHVLEEETAAPGPGYRIMVAVANPQNALRMVTSTLRLCGAKQARVELLHMVPVPDTVPLSDAGDYMLAGKEAILEAMLYLEPRFPISSTIRYCRNVARGIVNAARSHRAQMLILGWHGRHRSLGFSLGSTVDPVIERAPCDVVVLKGNCNGSFGRVLVPIAGGPNSRLALDTARIMAAEEARITAFTVLRDGAPNTIVDLVNAYQQELEKPDERISVKAVSASDVGAAILKAAEDCDLVVLGCTRKPLLYTVARESIPEEIARRCDKPMVMVHAATALQSWVKRWF